MSLHAAADANTCMFLFLNTIFNTNCIHIFHCLVNYDNFINTTIGEGQNLVLQTTCTPRIGYQIEVYSF